MMQKQTGGLLKSLVRELSDLANHPMSQGGRLLYSGIFRAILICLCTEDMKLSSEKGFSR